MNIIVSGTQEFQPVDVTFSLKSREEVEYLKSIFNPDYTWDELCSKDIPKGIDFGIIYAALNHI